MRLGILFARSFVLGLGCLSLAGAIRATGAPASKEAPAEEEPSYLSTQDTLLQRADQLEQNQRYGEAIRIYEELINAGAGRDLRWTAYLLFRTACAQYESGDRIGALESVASAINLDPTEPSYRAFRADTSGSRRSTVYRPRRDSGSARRLISTNGVLHVFVYGRNTEPWEPEEQEKARRRIEEADRWLQERSAEAGTPPTFVHRYLAVLEEPFWRRVPAPDSDSSPDYRRSWLEAVLARFQAGSYAELFDRVFDGMNLDNRSVVFHISSRGMFLAAFPRPRMSAGDLEGAFVQSEKTEWMTLYDAVSYAREFLHLYGADDLYDKAPDPDVPEREIMNYGAPRLDQCLLCELTRYAIGWTDQPPRLARLRIATPAVGIKQKKGKHG